LSTDREKAIELIGGATTRYDDGRGLTDVAMVAEAQVYALLDVASAIREQTATVLAEMADDA
jgi:hypothetical protein